MIRTKVYRLIDLEGEYIGKQWCYEVLDDEDPDGTIYVQGHTRAEETARQAAAFIAMKIEKRKLMKAESSVQIVVELPLEMIRDYPFDTKHCPRRETKALKLLNKAIDQHIEAAEYQHYIDEEY